MHQALLNHIQQNDLFTSTDKVLLAVSGGIDSSVLCYLFHKAGFSFAIAHCNFQLRDDESDEDESFVKELANHYHVPFHHIRFETNTYIKENKLSIQVAARELRYEWFEKIRREHGYAYIATAHHQGDVIETFFINLIRGTGISGLRSIVSKQGTIIRPLLFASKKDIVAYGEKNKILYREDSSNASDKYLRNKIRHHLLPVLKEFSPVAEESILHSIEKLRDAEFIYKQTIEQARSNICKEKNNTIHISITELQKLNPLTTYLYEFLKPYGFNAVAAGDILKALNGESGKRFLSTTHRLIKDRDFLIIEPLASSAKEEEYSIHKDQQEFAIPGIILHFQITKAGKRTIPVAPHIAAIDLDMLHFPLILRKWKTGDTFYPLGLNGKKKLSDFFIDKKLSLPEKENTWLLCSDDKIVWVIGMRIDERFKVTGKTTNILFIEQHDSR